MGGDTANLNGAEFEWAFDLRNILWSHNYYIDENNGWVYANNERVGIAAQKNDLHKFVFGPLGVDMAAITGIAREPDDFFLNFANSRLYIIEKKFQSSAGSKDDTLQAAPGRRREYWAALETIAAGANTLTDGCISTAMSYVLNDWYADDRYAWRLDENRAAGIPMMINDFPLSLIGLGDDGPIPGWLDPVRQNPPANQLMFDF